MSLNCQTDEILDSMLSLRRFTSLVRWEYVKDTFRPVRSTSTTQDIVLRHPTTQLPLYSIDGRLGTAASDGSITVGWVVHDYDYDGRDEWDYTANPTSERPYLDMTGLSTADGPLELVWFDDRRGTIIGKYGPFQQPEIMVQLPETEGTGNGFGKSVAFLIQPVGYTPEKVFAELPNELIGQISIDNADSWHEERPHVVEDQERNFTFRVKPSVDLSQHYFRWDLGDGTKYPPYPTDPPIRGKYSFTHTYYDPTGNNYLPVRADVYQDANGTDRVCGDVIHVRVLSPF